MCVVDARNFRRNLGEPVMLKQLKLATVVILNKRSQVSPEELAAVTAEVRAHNPEAQVHAADYCDVDIPGLLQCRFFADSIKPALLGSPAWPD